MVLNDSWLIYLTKCAYFIFQVILTDLPDIICMLLLLACLGLGILWRLHTQFVLFMLLVDVARVTKFVIDLRRLLLLSHYSRLPCQIALNG